jgi:hypothetical protein
VGIEIEPDLVERAQQLIDDLPAEYRDHEALHDNDRTGTKRVCVVQGDVRDVLHEFVTRLGDDGDQGSGVLRPYGRLPTPDVIATYLLPEGMAEIEEDLMKLLPTTRIVCAAWGLKAIRPIEQKVFYDRSGSQTIMYLYTHECFERLKGFEYMLSVYNH